MILTGAVRCTSLRLDLAGPLRRGRSHCHSLTLAQSPAPPAASAHSCMLWTLQYRLTSLSRAPAGLYPGQSTECGLSYLAMPCNEQQVAPELSNKLMYLDAVPLARSVAVLKDAGEVQRGSCGMPLHKLMIT